jgi:diacylglycerol kinase family enzyme
MTLVLLNPQSRGGRTAKCLPEIENWLHQHAPDCTLAAPLNLQKSLGLLRAQARGSRVVAVGGDGTINRWLPAILARELTLGVVPMGSGNDSARALGLHGQSWQTTLQHALQAPAQAVDVGHVRWTDLQGVRHDLPFLSSLTVGFDSAVALRALRGPRWLQGLPRYLWATLQELVQLQHWHLSVQVDGTPLTEGPALFLSSLNTPTYGSGLPAVPQAQMNDGQLDLLLAGPFSAAGASLMLPRLMTGKHLGHPLVRTQPYREMHISCPQGVPVAADGEYLGVAASLDVRCAPAELQIVAGVPPSTAA